MNISLNPDNPEDAVKQVSNEMWKYAQNYSIGMDMHISFGAKAFFWVYLCY